MRRIVVLLLAGAVIACGAKAPEKKSYTLYWTARQLPAGGVPVTLVVPPTLTETGLDAMGSPSFKLAGSGSPIDQVSVVAIVCPEGDCMEKAVALQFEPTELAAAKTEDLAAGRRWIAYDGKVTGGERRRVHARLFQVHTASKSMVMCVGMLLGADAEKLGEVRRLCESLSF